MKDSMQVQSFIVIYIADYYFFPLLSQECVISETSRIERIPD